MNGLFTTSISQRQLPPESDSAKHPVEQFEAYVGKSPASAAPVAGKASAAPAGADPHATVNLLLEWTSR
jgi:hypothetical protein